MSFDDITIVQGEAFVSLAAMIETAEVKGLPVRFCQDEGGVKVKTGSYTWSAALGERDPECAAAQRPQSYWASEDRVMPEPVAQSVDLRPHPDCYVRCGDGCPAPVL